MWDVIYHHTFYIVYFIIVHGDSNHSDSYGRNKNVLKGGNQLVKEGHKDFSPAARPFRLAY